MASPSRRTSLALTLILGVGLAVPLVEVLARVAGLAPPIRVIEVTHDDTVYTRSANPVLGFEIKPNWRDENADCRRSYPFTNSHGQRDVERTLAKPPGRERILLLGASVVEGVGLRDLDETISRQLEELIGDGTEVLNFGVSAYCTRAKVELLRVKGLAFDPDVVVLFVSANDFRNFNFETFELVEEAVRPPGADWLFARSHAFRAFAVRVNWFGYGAQNDPEAWNRAAIGDNNVVDGFATFAALAQEYGFDPVIAIWPRFTDEAVEDTDPLVDRFDTLVFEAIAEMNGLPSFRFSTYFRAELERHPDESPRRRYTIGDRLHPNAFGARLAAAALVTQLGSLRGAFRPGARPADAAAVEAARKRGEQENSGARRFVNVGNVQLSEGNVDDAIRSYRQAIAAESNLAEAHHNLGVALRSAGRYEEAMRSFETAIRLAPRLPDAYFNLGVTLRVLGRPAEAASALERALELQPEFEPARQELARARAEASSAPR